MEATRVAKVARACNTSRPKLVGDIWPIPFRASADTGDVTHIFFVSSKMLWTTLSQSAMETAFLSTLITGFVVGNASFFIIRVHAAMANKNNCLYASHRGRLFHAGVSDSWRGGIRTSRVFAAAAPDCR